MGAKTAKAGTAGYVNDAVVENSAQIDRVL